MFNIPIVLFLALAIVFPWQQAVGQGDAASESSPKQVRDIEKKLRKYARLEAGRVRVEVGTRTSGELGQDDLKTSEDGTPIDVVEFLGTKGEVITISVESDSFRPLTWLLERRHSVLIARGGVEGAGSVATMTTVLPRDGDYLLFVNSHHGTGRYEATIDREPPLVIPDDSETATRRAVLVGINDYVGIGNDLSASVHDVDAIRELLVTEAGFASSEILPIKDPYATRENIVTSIRSFLGSVPEDGTAVLYYSGHGVRLRAHREGDADGIDEALFLADGSYLVDDELRELVNCIDAKTVTVIVDSCYSGGLYRGRGLKSVDEEVVESYLDLAKDEVPEPLGCASRSGVAEKDVNVFISASRENEKAWEWDRWKHLSVPRSVFTRYLLEEASGALRDTPGVAVTSLIEKVADKTTTFTEANRHSIQQGQVVNYAREPSIGEALGLIGPSRRQEPE